MIGSTVVQNTIFVFIFLTGIYRELFVWLVVALVFSCAGVPFSCSLIFQDDFLLFFSESWPPLQENLFYYLEETCYCWDEKC